MELHPFQAEALDNIRASYVQGVRRLVVQSPTGSGKTVMAQVIVAGAQEKKKRVCFIVSRKALIDQTVEKFYAAGIRDIGVIQADHQLTDWSKPVQIASIQTLRSRGKYPASDIFIIDECHEVHKEHIKLLTNPDIKDKLVIGLSATPWTRGLGKYYESLLVVSTTKELIEQGYLSKFRVFAADHPNLDGVRIVAGDYHEKQLSGVMQENGLTANIVDTWKARWGKDKTLVFCVDRAHAQAVQERFEDAGILCGYQDANTTPKERKEIAEDFNSGDVPVVCNIQTLTTGVDWDVRCLVLARPTKSEILFVQIIGRALRTAPGKDHAVILDHSDTTARLGFVTDIHQEHLDDGKERKKPKKAKPRDAALPKPCQQCQMLMEPMEKVCRSCGFERKLQSRIFEKDGELNELLPGGGKHRTSRYDATMDEKGRFYAQLKWIARAKGRKEGWAARSYLDKFKVWPDYSIKWVEPMEPGAEVRNWVKSRDIAFWKSKKREAAAPKPPPLFGG